ncbi:glycoside hydrolase family 28 protein [Pedobacter sp. AW31-3R]|uniref:glycoside hydrolase family 28 protein n=1 Tax=Pedobacter sp. AW31-3R TaxID=3445781 RepID=UPI003FA18781
MNLILPSRSFFLLLLLLPLSAAFSQPKVPSWVAEVGARKFSFNNAIFPVEEYGARNDGKTLNTKAIQQAIDACAAKGGGRVTFSPGRYLTGSLFVKSGVDLHIGKGVELLGSQDINDYPDMDTRVAGIEMKWPAALINIIGQHKAAISGGGLVNAQGKPFWDFYWNLRKVYDAKGLRWIVDYDARRPRTVLVTSSSDVVVKELTFQQAGFWTVQVLYSSYVTVEHVTINNNVGGHGPSTDGVDIDSSSWVLVQHCDIDCNDDNFCLKAGRDWDGLRVNRPTEYVVIRNCVARKGAGLLTLGSETSGGIRHVWATDLVGYGTGNALNIKSAMTRGGTVEDVYFNNIVMHGVGNVLQVNPNWNPAYSYAELPAGYHRDSIPPHWTKLLARVEPKSQGIPKIKDINLYNIKASGAKKAIHALGMEVCMLRNFSLEKLDIQAISAGKISFAKDWKVKDVVIKAEDGNTPVITDSDPIHL